MSEGLKIRGCQNYLVGMICPTLVEIGLTDLLKWGGAESPRTWSPDPRGSDSPVIQFEGQGAKNSKRSSSHLIFSAEMCTRPNVYVCGVIYLSEIWKTRREISPATYNVQGLYEIFKFKFPRVQERSLRPPALIFSGTKRQRQIFMTWRFRIFFR